MLVLVFIFVLFFWLVVGAIQYLACVSVLRLRRFALSAALWWAVWGPCSIALMMLAGLAIVAEGFLMKDGHLSGIHLPRFPLSVGWAYLLLEVLGTAAIATVVAWLHQVVVRRFTFALFRLYATAVSAGIGSVFGWCFGWWIQTYGLRYGWLVGLTILVSLTLVFGVMAYRNARSLRGSLPSEFAWLSPQEFDGV